MNPSRHHHVHHVVVGPTRHGVTRYAELLLAAAPVPAACVVRLPSADDTDLEGLLSRLPAAAPVHVHVTDHLLGGPERCLRVVRALAAGRVLGLTLHDLPQPSDGAPYERRRACYAGMVAAADVVVVSSEHEAALLRDLPLAGCGTPVRVVPLAAPVPPPAGPRAGAGGDRRQVAVLGFVYPGKGHEEVLEAMAGLPGDVGLRVVGGPSPGHDGLVARLHERAAAAGRPLQVDGWVPDERLPGLLRDVAVPVYAPRHVSASASVTAWTAAGRRPVATRNRYSEELERRHPGSLLLVEDSRAGLAAGLAAALADPSTTWLAEGHVAGPHPAEAARLTVGAVLAVLPVVAAPASGVPA